MQLTFLETPFLGFGKYICYIYYLALLKYFLLKIFFNNWKFLYLNVFYKVTFASQITGINMHSSCLSFLVLIGKSRLHLLSRCHGDHLTKNETQKLY